MTAPFWRRHKVVQWPVFILGVLVSLPIALLGGYWIASTLIEQTWVTGVLYMILRPGIFSGVLVVLQWVCFLALWLFLIAVCYAVVFESGGQPKK